MRIIQVYDKLDRHGGAQSVMMTLHQYFVSNDFDVLFSGFPEYEDTYFNNEISRDHYKVFKFSNIKKFTDAIIISHSRKMTTLLIIFNKIFRLNNQIIHVAHSIFKSKKYISLYPENVIAISNAVKNNLINYFNIDEKNISVIYNGLKDERTTVLTHPYQTDEDIKILFVGRIEDVKQQVKVVKELSGKLKKHVKIHFVGKGSQVQQLIRMIDEKGKENFEYLGFSTEVTKLINEYHYVMLFSQKEGLGLSLIEGCMMGRPLITRGNKGCEACAEVCIDQYNGYIINTIDELIEQLNRLDCINAEQYNRLCLNSRQVYEEKFKLELMLSSYSQYVDELLKKVRTK